MGGTIGSFTLAIQTVIPVAEAREQIQLAKFRQDRIIGLQSFDDEAFVVTKEFWWPRDAFGIKINAVVGERSSCQISLTSLARSVKIGRIQGTMVDKSMCFLINSDQLRALQGAAQRTGDTFGFRAHLHFEMHGSVRL